MMGKRLIAVSLVLCLGCVRNTGTIQKDEEASPSGLRKAGQHEIDVGRQIHQAITATFRVYTEPRVVGYVNRIGKSLARHAERKNFPYQFTILYDDRVYATEAPGGFVYITTGFLNFIQNEAELAAVLAHEIGELQHQDPELDNSRRLLELLTQTSAVVGGFFGPVGALTAGGFALLNLLNESRAASPEERVRRADRKALHYLVEAGEDPQGYLDLLSRFLNQDPALAPYTDDYLTSHPVTLKRYQEALAEFEKLPLAGRSLTVNRQRYLEMTKGVCEIYR